MCVRVEQLSHVSYLVLGESRGVAEDPVALRALVLLLDRSFTRAMAGWETVLCYDGSWGWSRV